jgi:FkbM family methyltransferase
MLGGSVSRWVGVNEDGQVVSRARESMLTRYLSKLRQKGLRAIIRDRLRWYRLLFEMDNWLVGKAVEWTGNRVRMHGLRFSVDNPLISTRHKSTLFFGRYEVDEIELARRYLDPDLPLVELGGSIGVVACVTNRLLCRPDRHVVVEASPVLLPTLEANRTMNGCRFRVEHAAVAYNSDAIHFPVDGHFLHGRIGGSDKTARVRAVTLGRLLDKYDFETINIVSDIEGAEIELVEREPDVLRGRVKTLVMEAHACYCGEDKVSAMLAALARLGFDAGEPLAGGKAWVVVMVNRNL